MVNEDFVEMISRVMMGLVKERERRKATQHAVERVVLVILVLISYTCVNQVY